MSRSWSVYDFILVWLGGLVGGGVLIAVGVAVADDNWLILLSLAGQYVGNLSVFWILTRYKDGRQIGLRIEGSDVLYVGLGVILQIGLALLFLPISSLLFPEGRPPQAIADVIANADTASLKIGLVVAAVVLGPITEELMYRGILLKSLERRGRGFALVLSSVVFSGVHLTGLETESLWQLALVVLPPLFILGMILAWLTQRNSRLGPAIFLHSGWNLLSAFVLLLPTEFLDQLQ